MRPILRTVVAKLTGRATEGTESQPDGHRTPETDVDKPTPSPEAKEDHAVDIAAIEKAPSNNNGSASAADNPHEDGEKDPKPTVEVSQDKNAACAEEDEASKYLSGTKLYLLTFGLALSTFVIALDNTIIATAIPRITTDFNALNVGLTVLARRARSEAIV